MADNLIDACADGFGESFVVERSGYGALLGCEAGYEVVDVLCGDARLDKGGYLVEDGGIDEACLADSFDLVGCFDEIARGHGAMPCLCFEDAAVELSRLRACGHSPFLFVALLHVAGCKDRVLVLSVWLLLFSLLGEGSIFAVMKDVVFSGDYREPLREVVEELKPDRLFVLVDDNTERLCLSLFRETGLEVQAICIPHGDDAKNVESLALVWRALSDGGASRGSLLCCLGGGMVTDLGGFAAATFKRGIACINVPTTLLAMVDASVGGKTGINLESLKNEVGAFSVPDRVIIDTCWLATLDRENMLSGFAEMLKHSLLSDYGMLGELLNFDIVNPDLERLAGLIERSVAVKQRVVEADPREEGLRKALNLGHTIGHAVETWGLRHERAMLHGYAVAMGLVGELYLSHKLEGFPSGTLRQVTGFVKEHYGAFPPSCKEVDELIELMGHDKKNRGGRINFTLLKDVGSLRLDCLPERGLIGEAVEFCCDAL